MHASVLSGAPKSASLSVLNYLLSIFPAAIEYPSASASLTPLALSFVTGRTDTASALIKAGADQTTRDATSKNIVHLALVHLSKISTTDQASKFRSLLSLIEPRLLPGMFVERCRDSPGGLTPLAYWLASFANNSYKYGWVSTDPGILSVILEYGGAESLTMMDSSGQFPLHQAVKQSYTGLVRLMLEHDPALLSRENAMGQTPLELAESLYVRDCTQGNPDIRKDGYRKLVDRDAEEFVDSMKQDEKGDEEEKNDIRATWKVCKECAVREPRSRKLVSVNEAREVARRLAERNKAKNEEKREGGVKKRTDEVDTWLPFNALKMG